MEQNLVLVDTLRFSLAMDPNVEEGACEISASSDIETDFRNILEVHRSNSVKILAYLEKAHPGCTFKYKYPTIDVGDISGDWGGLLINVYRPETQKETDARLVKERVEAVKAAERAARREKAKEAKRKRDMALLIKKAKALGLVVAEAETKKEE